MTEKLHSKPIIFCDWYGVLSDSLLFVGISNEIKAKIQPIILDNNKQLLRDACLKLSGREFCNIIANRLNLNQQEILDYYIQGWHNITWNQSLIDLLQRYRQKYTLILISDNLEEFGTIVALKLSNFFDEVHCSHQIG